MKFNSIKSIRYTIFFFIALIPCAITFIDSAVTVDSINSFDEHGFTPLMNAAATGDLITAKRLIDDGADINIHSQDAYKESETALGKALINGDILNSLQIAKLLILSGAQVNDANAYGSRPIHLIMRITEKNNRKNMLDMLIAAGADINAQDNNGETMMHLTANTNDYNWALMMREYNQIINRNLKNKEGLTALDLARNLGHVGVSSIEEAFLQMPKFIGDDFNFRTVDDLGRNGLMLAIMRADYPFASNLIKRRAPLNVQDKYGNTALHYAVLTSLTPEKFVDLILSQNPSKQIVNMQNQMGETPLMEVVKIVAPGLRIPLAKKLLAKGADPEIKNNQGLNVLDLAKRADDASFTRFWTDSYKENK